MNGESEGLILRNVSVAYDRRIVLRGVSAAVKPGEIVGIVGPNGGGKSTLLKAVLGVAPLAGGTAMLFGLPAARQRRRMAYVPQRESVEWDFPVSVHDVVMIGRYPHTGFLHRPRPVDRDIVDDALRCVDMFRLADRQIGQLSGGQQQRAFIARALAQQAGVLLLDEPMTGIDATTQEIILEIILEEGRKGKIVLMATHDLATASSVCDSLCFVNERMVAYGPSAETYTAATISATFGGPVVVLGPNGAELHPPSPGLAEAAHHHHVHENLGREHD